jgi:hypothetical protein
VNREFLPKMRQTALLGVKSNNPAEWAGVEAVYSTQQQPVMFLSVRRRGVTFSQLVGIESVTLFAIRSQRSDLPLQLATIADSVDVIWLRGENAGGILAIPNIGVGDHLFSLAERLSERSGVAALRCQGSETRQNDARDDKACVFHGPFDMTALESD